MKKEKTEFQRVYSILGGLLFNINCVEVYMSREDYPKDMVSRSKEIQRIISFVKKQYNSDHITLTWNIFQDYLSKAINVPRKKLDRSDKAELYYTLWEKAEEAYDREKESDEYFNKWKAELKWAVENYIKEKSLWLSLRHHKMLKKECFGETCGAECDVKKHCGKCYKSNCPPMDYILNLFERENEKLRNLKSDTRGIVSIFYDSNIEERKKRHREKFQRRQDGHTLLGYTTGLNTIDDWTGGFIKGSVMTILARTGQGKSALALQMCSDCWAKEPVNVLYLNLEINKIEIQDRLDSALTGVDFDKIYKGKWSSEREFNKFQDKLENLIEKKVNRFKILDVPELTVGQLRAIFLEHYRLWGDNFIIVLDNLNITDPPTDMSLTDGMNHMAKEFHKYVKEFNCCGLMVAQLNREADNEKKRITGKHLRDCDKLLDHVDSAFAIVPLGGKQWKKLLTVKGRAFAGTTVKLQNRLYRMRMEEDDSMKGDYDKDDESFLAPDEEMIPFA